MICRLGIFILLASLVSCASFKKKDYTWKPELMPIAMPIGPKRRVVQQLTVIWPRKQQTFLCVLEMDNKHIALVGLSIEGMTLFSLTYDGKKITLDKSPLLPEVFSPEEVVNALQLAYWPKAVLRITLPKPWRLEADILHRSLYFANERRVDVEYLEPDKNWPRTVDLVNHQKHYQLHIKTVSYEASPD